MHTRSDIEYFVDCQIKSETWKQNILVYHQTRSEDSPIKWQYANFNWVSKCRSQNNTFTKQPVKKKQL